MLLFISTGFFRRGAELVVVVFRRHLRISRNIPFEKESKFFHDSFLLCIIMTSNRLRYNATYGGNWNFQIRKIEFSRLKNHALHTTHQIYEIHMLEGQRRWRNQFRVFRVDCDIDGKRKPNAKEKELSRGKSRYTTYGNLSNIIYKCTQ